MIVRPVYWQGILGHLQALPKDGLPVTDPDWHTLDRALYNVTDGLRTVVVQLGPLSLLPTLTGHTNIVNSVDFSPDDQTLASGSSDKSIKLWNLATGQEVRTLSEHIGYVSSVTFRPDGQTLASGSFDKTVKIWGKK